LRAYIQVATLLFKTIIYDANFHFISILVYVTLKLLIYLDVDFSSIVDQVFLRDSSKIIIYENYYQETEDNPVGMTNPL
jgi:hypothetical protein